jgi:peptidoglycan/LPS O-acetylase OafA/YrhL
LSLSRANPVLVAIVALVLTPVLFLFGLHDEWKPLVHFADFLMGIAAAGLYERVRHRVAGAWLYLPALLGMAILIAWPGLLPSWVDLNTALRPLYAFLLVGLAVGKGAAARALAAPLTVFLGKSSYAMYILHIPVLWWMKRWSPGYSAGLYLTVVILLSAMVYRYFEEPANRYIRGLPERARRYNEPLTPNSSALACIDLMQKSM